MHSFLTQVGNDVFLATKIDRAKFDAVVAKFRTEVRPLVIAATPRTVDDDRQLTETMRSRELAAAQVAEVEARRKTAEIIGDAGKLVALNREVVNAKAALATAEEVLAAAIQIHQRRAEESHAGVDAERGRIVNQVSEMLAEERDAVKGALTGELGDLIHTLAGVEYTQHCLALGYIGLQRFIQNP